MNVFDLCSIMKVMKRERYLHAIQKAYKSHSVVAILGPRQCGKTTLARLYVEEQKEQVHFFDFEDPADLVIFENPKTALEPLEGLIVLDEVQRIPELFPVLRVLVDKPNSKQRFLVLGSASRDLLRQSSETLAGRIAYLELPPFSLFEVGNDAQRLWLRGGFPRSYLADSDDDSHFWRKQYISTFLERDIPSLGIRIPPESLRRFWMMLAHYHGQIFNAAEIGRSMGISDTTIRSYLDILTGTFMVRQLLPWQENAKKRQVKKPKIYFRDSGIFHTLNGLDSYASLLRHPKLGASWEGFALEEVIRQYGVDSQECFFWSVHSGPELDLMLHVGGKRLGFEFKYSDAPRLTPSMTQSLEALGLEHLFVVYPGQKKYALSPDITVTGLKDAV